MATISTAEQQLGVGQMQEATLTIKQGLLRLSQEHPGDASAAPLHTLLCHLLTDGGSYSEAQLQAEAGYKLVEGQYGLANPAAVSLQGIQLGVSLAADGTETARAVQLLLAGRAVTQQRLDSLMKKEGGMSDAATRSMAGSTVAQLAECDFYIALALVRKALLSGAAPEVPLGVLRTKWLDAIETMTQAKGATHRVVVCALRELGRASAEAEGRPEVHAELQAVLRQGAAMVAGGGAAA